MRRRGLAALLAGCLLAACGGGGADPAPAPPPPPPSPAWAVLGSSTAAGTGASAGRGWAALLAARLEARGLRLDNRARGGATTYAALPAATPRPAGRPATDPAQDIDRVLEAAPRVVLLAFPSNDAVLGFGADESVANLLLLRERARQRGAAVLVLSSQPRDDAAPAARAAMQAMDDALAAAIGPCFVPLRAALAGADGGIASAYAAGDGVHLNDAGHALVAERLWATVSAGGCVAPP